MPSYPSTYNVLTCAECGRQDEPGERGWKGYRSDLFGIEVFCPECAEREFGVGDE